MTDQNRQRLGMHSNLEHRPALDALKQDQMALMWNGERGLYRRRDVLLWLQRVAVRSFGYLPDPWFTWISTTRHMTAAFLKDQEQRDAMLPDGLEDEMSDSVAKAWRTSVLDQHVEPAFSMALKRLTDEASQYETSGKNPTLPDPEEQEAPGMRPVLQDLEEQQQVALEAFLDGFEDMQEVRAWVPEVRAATEQLLPPDFLKICKSVPWIREPLTTPRLFHARAQLAGGVLLPLMNSAVPKALANANEYVTESRTRHSPTKGY